MRAIETCALCGKQFANDLDKNNGFPLTDKDVCAYCNCSKVIPARMKLVMEEKKNGSKAN